MLKNSKLKDRLLIGYGVPVALSLGLTTLMYLTANKVFDTFKEVERVQSVIIGVNKTVLNGEIMVRSFRGYVAVKNEVFVDEYNTASEEFERSITDVDALIIKEEQEQRLKSIRKVKNEFDVFAKNVIQLLKQGKQEEALAEFNTETGQKFVEKFESLGDEFSRVEQQLLEMETEKQRRIELYCYWY